MAIARRLCRRACGTISLLTPLLQVTYGTHMAIAMGIGLLFLGGGMASLGRENEHIAALLGAFFPRCVCAGGGRGRAFMNDVCQGQRGCCIVYALTLSYLVVATYCRVTTAVQDQQAAQHILFFLKYVFRSCVW